MVDEEFKHYLKEKIEYLVCPQRGKNYQDEAGDLIRRINLLINQKKESKHA